MNAYIGLTDEMIQFSIALALLTIITANLVMFSKHLKRILGGG